MERSKTSADEPDLTELLHLKEDVLANREESTGLREEVDLLRKEVQNMNSKQDAMTKVISGVQSAVAALSGQLSTITDMLKTLGANMPSSSAGPRVGVQEQEQQPERPSEADEIQKQGTEEHHRPLADELRKRLALEQEKTRQCAVHRITPN